MASIEPLFGWAAAPVSLGLALFIMLLEVLVAFIQAYIFSVLSVVYIESAIYAGH